MASTTVASTDTAAKTIGGGDRLTVTASGRLVPAGPAVRFNLASAGTATIANSGTIAPSSGRAIDTTGTASGRVDLVINNNAGASITGVSDFARIQSSLRGGSIAIDNQGTLAGGTGRGINVQEIDGLSAFTLANQAGATFTSSGDVIRLTTGLSSLTFGGTVSIDNAGTIRSTGLGDSNGQAIDLNDVKPGEAGHISILNRAGGVIEAADADAIRPGAYASVVNYGSITGGDASNAGGNDGIDGQDKLGISVSNHQTITGTRHGITGDHAMTIQNDGTITGQAGSGINLDTAATEVATITNDGKIIGIAPSGGDGDAIDVDGLVDLTNHGTISALGHSGDGLSEALAIGGGTVDNTGTIISDQRAITVDNSDLGPAFGALTLLNEAGGTITGLNGQAIAIAGDLADTINN